MSRKFDDAARINNQLLIDENKERERKIRESQINSLNSLTRSQNEDNKSNLIQNDDGSFRDNSP